mmetsp:Transcript_19290/g.47701  ORF Transcript_19290/g.47701 Transcript_19290/m.47701 type:complete len:231 (-) Transcript_19290:441-1133(-)
MDGNNSNSDDNNLLRRAAKEGNLTRVQDLLENGSNVHAAAEDGLLLASQNGHLEICKVLVEKGGAEVPTEDDDVEGGCWTTALHKACENGHLEIVQWLVLEKDANVCIHEMYGDGLTPLDLASEKGYREMAEVLVQNAAPRSMIRANMRAGHPCIVHAQTIVWRSSSYFSRIVLTLMLQALIDGRLCIAHVSRVIWRSPSCWSSNAGPMSTPGPTVMKRHRCIMPVKRAI